MYTLLKDFTPRWKRTRINLNSVGRSEFRKMVASTLIIMSLLLFAVSALIISMTNMNTTAVNYSAYLANVRANNTHH